MSIRFRLILSYTCILAIVLALYGTAVYLISQATLLDEVDSSLKDTASEVREEMQAVDFADRTIIKVPQNLDVFETASMFIVILDPRGDVITYSSNLADWQDALDPNGLRYRPHYSIVTDYEKPLRVYTIPLLVDIGPGSTQRLLGYIQVGRLLDGYAALERLGLLLLLTGVGAVCFSLFLGALLTHSLLKPLDDIAAVALQITRADDLSRRLPDRGRNDEIGRLTLVLNQTLERLERLFRAQQRFLADVSHELRTPLTTIRGNIDLMRRMDVADPETLDVIQEEVARMTRLVDDLMLLARADSGGLPIQRQAVELDNVFLEVCRQVSSIEPPVDVVLAEVDQVCVLGDVDRLKQLILNLVDNALKYTPPGGTVTMSLSKLNGMVQIVVSDTGVGIAEEDLHLIFERFYRIDKARNRSHGGSGLGLSIAKWIAQAHGGDIEVTSKLGKGSTFYVTLPILVQKQTAPTGEVPEKTRPGLRTLRSGR